MPGWSGRSRVLVEDSAFLESEARRIRLSQIVACIDGDAIYRGCALGLAPCNAREPGPLHESFLQVREDQRHMLETTTLHDLVSGLREGRTVLKR